MTLKAVFFDLDGTLLDTAPDLAQALNHTLAAEGKEPLPFEEIRRVVSDGANAMLELGFGIDRNSTEIQPLRQKLLDFYLDDLSSKTSPFKGIINLIQKLSEHEIKWGIATNKPWLYTEPLMERFEFASEPVCVICPEHVEHRKPAPDSMYLACEKANCETSEAIYIGDHKRDILCGKNANMTTIAAGYGYIAEDDTPVNWHADHIVDTGDQLWSIIKSYVS